MNILNLWLWLRVNVLRHLKAYKRCFAHFQCNINVYDHYSYCCCYWVLRTLFNCLKCDCALQWVCISFMLNFLCTVCPMDLQILISHLDSLVLLSKKSDTTGNMGKAFLFFFLFVIKLLKNWDKDRGWDLWRKNWIVWMRAVHSSD